MQIQVTNPSLFSWLHISALNPSLRPLPPALAFRLIQLLSQYPVCFPPAPAVVQAPSPTLDLAPGLSPLAPVPLLPLAWMDLSSGKVWPHVARLSRIQVISSDRCNRLLPEPAALRGWRDGETEKRRESETRLRKRVDGEGRRRREKERRYG